MKARVKSTGVLVDVIPLLNVNAQHSKDNIYVCDNMIFRECELDFLNIGNSAIDWEQRRYELAKSAMQGYCIALGMDDGSSTFDDIAVGSIRVANALIKRLKENNDDE